MQRRMTATANKVESFDWFSLWPGFGNRGVIADNDPVEQEKAMKLNALLTNAVFSELPRRGFRSPLQGRRRFKVLPWTGGLGLPTAARMAASSSTRRGAMVSVHSSTRCSTEPGHEIGIV
ncbi:Tn3 family transposase [Streptomyces sp. NPDC005065]|uniref:Tn3 family transposase n=1 Tax=Streptomyces sp. NPDC005065 TaxID=3154461 RepID=UPI0033A363AA